MARRSPAKLVAELSPEERAFQKVARVVSIREQSTATMRAKLAQAGFEEAVVEGALERARACGFEQELDALGVGLEEVQAYQEHCEDGGDEVSRALDALARKRFTAKNRWQAGYRFLVQRGYSNDAASSAVRLWIESE